MRFAYEWRDDSGNWFRAYGNENWEFDESGLMRRRIASINDLPIEEARAILRPHQIIGRSNALLEEALESERQGADYLAVGAIFPTDTKEKTRPAGLETLEQVKARVSVPVVAIGGINKDNVIQVMQAGADASCVISAVIGDPDPEEAARRLVESMSSLSPY